MTSVRLQDVEKILRRFDSSSPGFAGYKNHVCRLISFACEMGEFAEDDLSKLTVAACFHDLGIFTADTFDYLPPSIELARNYLNEEGLREWTDEVVRMIDDHHCVRSVDDRLTEIFRRADLIDFSLGTFRFDVPRSKVREIKRSYPNLGFHRFLVKTAGSWICRHPLNPVPVLKW